ncbi:cell division protein FtsH [Candidatus Kuenenbacteria bacterium RIFCSPLOWO2_12_FULL_42_13]|uniref:ATP-dependent zinc metalloprotease FtsH n=3 Tax=Candidatus Kueneniibacteriota TaxID=1752740 RepID=A0A0G0YV47_9BACT|nr:MAG: ATP-dependent zinc metalloprotease FtsH [Candidatus Kuenenbacteria bacterium GW2011_GWA2_42_15]OGG89999.1 MAG: cell division protein FtsH [Candidatus Kuenenbacteria bacterium RIFCSPHIGHO2_02_FULL_42_29]OGG91886.1 MAG: cell division protein FtsH [Candidatus Kuenenbacteria bacterium RIFCSPLOWO2_12_FULL_42_13]OGH00352.1 MAG: cell division protein FtsH [Candidatus Kuenenbacteria bacterium RIFCSPHIGHO2_12_FULL_42_14]
MKNISKTFLAFFVMMIVTAGILSLFENDNAPKTEIGLGQLAGKIKAGEVEKIEVRGNELKIFTKDKKEETAYKESVQSLSEALVNYGVTEEELRATGIAIKTDTGWQYWLSVVLPFLLPFLLIIAFVYFVSRQVQGVNKKAMSFGQSAAKADRSDENKKQKVKFDQVAGAREAKAELEEIVQFLEHPKKFIDLGAKIPKGVLLIGPPGCGKTLLARAVAGEAGVPFFYVSGSEFVEMFVGVGASRVRSLFDKAKKNAPCIVFLDELDAVGRRRGTGLGGSHDEREQTLNQILVEMDGFEPNEGVILLAATNRPDVLDPALLRPGRFDRRVVVDLPDLKDREEILKIHAMGKPLTNDVDLHTVAARTPGFSGADLSNLLNEAAILAAKQDKKQVAMVDILESIDKVMIGPERKSRMLSEKEKKVTAYHEAGHAVVAHSLPNADPVHKISIISRGQAGGYTIKLPTEDKHMHAYSEFLDEMAVLLGGYAAEKLVFGEITTGATSDLKRATEIAKDLVMQYGMSHKLAPRTFGERDELIFFGKEISEPRDYSEKLAEKIDEEVADYINEARKSASDILTKRREVLEKVTEALLAKEVLEREEFEKIVGEKGGNKEQLTINKEQGRTQKTPARLASESVVGRQKHENAESTKAQLTGNS